MNIKYRDGMTEEQLVRFLEQQEQEDALWAEACQYNAKMEEQAADDEELEVEYDLYRYWKP